MSTPTSTSSARNEVRRVVAGWPSAMSAARVAKQVFEERQA
jgi:hypothetical protein